MAFPLNANIQEVLVLWKMGDPSCGGSLALEDARVPPFIIMEVFAAEPTGALAHQCAHTEGP